MLTIILGGAIIALAIVIMVQRIRRVLRGESACSSCNGQCSSCSSRPVNQQRP